jgi:hypothetical protein
MYYRRKQNLDCHFVGGFLFEGIIDFSEGAFANVVKDLVVVELAKRTDFFDILHLNI